MAPLTMTTAAATHTVRQSNSTSGSMTVTQTNTEPSIPFNLPSGTLRLRAEPAEERHIQWAEDVVDNEGMGKKSSKVCCIYHKPRAVDESSDESSSDSSSDSESDASEPDNSTARPAGRLGGNARGRHHHHHHGHGHGHDRDRGHEGGGEGKGKSKARRKRSPNAYEKMPKHGGAKTGGSQ